MQDKKSYNNAKQSAIAYKERIQDIKGAPIPVIDDLILDAQSVMELLNKEPRDARRSWIKNQFGKSGSRITLKMVEKFIEKRNK